MAVLVSIEVLFVASGGAIPITRPAGASLSAALEGFTFAALMSDVEEEILVAEGAVLWAERAVWCKNFLDSPSFVACT